MIEQMKTSHTLCIGDARSMSEIEDQSVDLVLTSPPYPMIQMWDNQFIDAEPEIGNALSENNGSLAFEHMHRQLDPVWDETLRILKPGGMACINIGDATRTLGGNFQLFANHARSIDRCLSLGFTQLPAIIWRKPTNAPTKFMGSGMLPAGAYVTLEHEYILIFRKNGKRTFDDAAKLHRRESAYFWEERNAWFSDVWFDLRGASQLLNSGDKHQRSGAFPLELAYRLISMFSIRADTVVDPFLGSGTTSIAAMCTARNSLGYEVNEDLQPVILKKMACVPETAFEIVRGRLNAHQDFIRRRMKSKSPPKHTNRPYGFPVMTRQEEDLRLFTVQSIQYQSSRKVIANHQEIQPQVRALGIPTADERSSVGVKPPGKGRQLKMF